MMHFSEVFKKKVHFSGDLKLCCSSVGNPKFGLFTPCFFSCSSVRNWIFSTVQWECQIDFAVQWGTNIFVAVQWVLLAFCCSSVGFIVSPNTRQLLVDGLFSRTEFFFFSIQDPVAPPCRIPKVPPHLPHPNTLSDFHLSHGARQCLIRRARRSHQRDPFLHHLLHRFVISHAPPHMLYALRTAAPFARQNMIIAVSLGCTQSLLAATCCYLPLACTNNLATFSGGAAAFTGGV